MRTAGSVFGVVVERGCARLGKRTILQSIAFIGYYGIVEGAMSMQEAVDGWLPVCGARNSTMFETREFGGLICKLYLHTCI